MFNLIVVVEQISFYSTPAVASCLVISK